MNASRTAVFFLFFLSAAGAATARADAFAAADEAISRVETRLDDLEAPRLAGRYSSEADCLKRFDLDALLRDATGSAMTGDLSRQMDPVVQYSFRYYTCVAAVRGDDKACDLLTAFDDYARPHPHLECTRYSKELIYIRAFMTGGPNLPALCRADLTHAEDNEYRVEDIDAVCSIMISDSSRPVEACGRLSRYFIKPSQLRKCQAWIGSLSGDDAGCKQLSDNDVRERCFAYAYFHKAHETGDVKDCKGSGICEMFMGGGEASCAYYSRRIAAHLCSLQPARNARLAKERAALGAELEKAEAVMKALPAGPAAEARRRRLQLSRGRFGSIHE